MKKEEIRLFLRNVPFVDRLQKQTVQDIAICSK